MIGKRTPRHRIAGNLRKPPQKRGFRMTSPNAGENQFQTMAVAQGRIGGKDFKGIRRMEGEDRTPS